MRHRVGALRRDPSGILIGCPQDDRLLLGGDHSVGDLARSPSRVPQALVSSLGTFSGICSEGCGVAKAYRQECLGSHPLRALRAFLRALCENASTPVPGSSRLAKIAE